MEKDCTIKFTSIADGEHTVSDCTGTITKKENTTTISFLDGDKRTIILHSDNTAKVISEGMVNFNLTVAPCKQEKAVISAMGMSLEASVTTKKLNVTNGTLDGKQTLNIDMEYTLNMQEHLMENSISLLITY